MVEILHKNWVTQLKIIKHEIFLILNGKINITK